MSERIATLQYRFIYDDLGILEYKQALDSQINAVTAKIENPEEPDLIFMVEHPPVFTIGKNSTTDNLIVSKSFLASKGIKVVPTKRGGDITYHGPGQIVMYPIINLEKKKISVKEFVYGLEEMMILTLQGFGIHSERNPKNHGIWVKDNKIGSVGLGIKKGISFHGIALNINADLTPFSWINPCGLTDVSMTSVQKELNALTQTKFSISKLTIPKLAGSKVSVPSVKDRLKKHFCSVFNFSEI